MKVTKPLNLVPDVRTRPDSRPPEAPEPFQALLKQRCQEAGAPIAPGPGGAILELTSSALDLLERIAAQMAGAASGSEMTAPHEQLARQAGLLRQAAEGLKPGPLKEIVAETAALSFLQLWRFEQGELF